MAAEDSEGGEDGGAAGFSWSLVSAKQLYWAHSSSSSVSWTLI